MSEYGRYVQTIPDREKRSVQAKAIVKVMEYLNPGVRSLEDYEHKLWDHLFMISGFDLDIDAPYPCPEKTEFETKPVPLPMKGTKIRASHYGRNIERILDLIAGEPEGEVKTYLIKSLAVYMRQQYLIWNKDSVSDETIFSDIEKLSEGKVVVPEGIVLDKVADNMDLSRPGIGIQAGKSKQNRKGGHRNRRR